MNKLHILEKLMEEFMGVNKEMVENMDIPAFVKANVNANVSMEDIVQYSEVFEGLTKKMDHSSPLFDKFNRPSMIALVAYSFENDIDLDKWIVKFFADNHTYRKNQQENLQHMVDDLKEYMESEDV